MASLLSFVERGVRQAPGIAEQCARLPSGLWVTVAVSHVA
jgi:hypothetical protein